MNVRPIDGAALYEAFREELKRHPVPETPGLGRYRAQVWLEAAGFFMTMLTKAPTIDAMPVVRCKGCKRAGKGPAVFAPGHINCGLRMRPAPVRPDDFCSYGERRADSANYEK